MTNFPYKIIDLTHTINQKTPSWDGGCGFKHEVEIDYADCQGEVKFKVQKIKMEAGIGTHIDAPAHVMPGAATVEKLELKNLICSCVCIDVSKSAGADFQLMADDVVAFEKKHGQIYAGSFVIVYTGWDCYWEQPEKYRNKLQFPTVSESAALILIKKKIVGLGIDTLSPDCPSNGFLVHKHLLGTGKYIVENIANASQLPPVGSFTLTMPIKGEGLTEAPVRLIGLINRE